MVVKNKESICFIENKVNSSEGDRQLERYSNVLNEIKVNDNKRVYLRYCTKYYDKKDISNINFEQYRWSDVYTFLNQYKENKIIEECLEFLRSEGMSSAGDFNFQDLIVLSNINATIAKMDECLDMVKPKLTECFGKPYERDYERLKQICQNEEYVMWTENIIGDGYSEVIVGFEFRDESKIPKVIVSLVIAKNNSEFVRFTNKINEGEKIFDGCVEDTGANIYYFEKPLSDFISSSNQSKEICEWFAKKIDIINTLK